MNTGKSGKSEQEELMAACEVEDLRAEIAALRQEIEELRHEADIEACHAAGLAAQIKALIAESDACPHKEAHPLVERVEYTHARTGERVMKTRAFPLYREAFDAEARECGIDNPEDYRG